MKNFPLIKFTFLFICGIVLEKLLGSSSSYFYFAFSLMIIFLVIIFYFRSFPQRSKVISFLVFFLIIVSGQYVMYVDGISKNFLSDKFYSSNTIRAYGTIKSINLIKENYFDFILSTDSVFTERAVTKKNVLLLCRLMLDNKTDEDLLYNKLACGNKIEVIGILRKGREKRNPGEFDYNNYLMQQGISGIINVNQNDELKIINAKQNFNNIIFKIKKNIYKGILKLHNQETSALLRGLLLADRSLINFEIRNYFVNSGVIHVLAVSGLHVGYIVFIFLILFGRFNIYLRSFLTISGILFFMLLTGMPASVVRASIMSITIISVMMTTRSTNIFNSLAFAALIILVFSPFELFDPGFQLSFLSVFSIASIYPFVSRKISLLNIPKLIKNIFLFMGVSISAQLGTMPFILLYFGKLSLTSLLANLITIPTIGLIVAIGIVTIFINIFLPSIAVFYASANELITRLLFSFIQFMGNPSYSFLSVKNFSYLDVVIFYSTIIFFFVEWKKFSSVIAKFIFVVLLLINLILLTSIDNRRILKDNQLNVMMIDIGQGDSFLLKFPNGQTALIDAGNVTPFFDNGEQVILPLIKTLDIDKIDFGFISHIDSDHYAGFVPLINYGVIDKIIKKETDTNNVKDVKFVKFALSHLVPVEQDKKNILKIGNARIYLLNKINSSMFGNSTNDNSLVMKVVYGKTSILFTGDLSRKGEKYYIDKYGEFLRSDILKVGHHGSVSSTSNEFLNIVNPKICLISVGERNKFGHPSEEVISKINKLGSIILRTDKNKAELLASDGKSFKVINWKEM